MLKEGDIYSHEFSYTQDDVVTFAKLTGDNNPIHLDEKYAAKTMFKKPIIHGALSSSVFSKILGTEFPGEGTVYLSQTSNFKRPMFVEVRYIAQFEVVSVNDKKQAIISTTIKDKETGKVTVDGTASVMNREKF